MEERYVFALSFLILFAVGLVSYSIFRHHLPTRRLRKHGIKVKAKVLGEFSQQYRYFLAPSRIFEVSFTTQSGQEITTQGVLEVDLSVLHDSSKLPDEVDIYYDKNKPTKIAIGESGFGKKPAIYLILAAAVITMVFLMPLYIISF